MKTIVYKFLLIFVFCNLATSSASALSCTSLTKTLSKDQENSEVFKLQQFLFDRGYLPVKPNGYFGSKTLLAVKKFQSTYGLAQVGFVGPATRSKINEISCMNSNQVIKSTQPQSTFVQKAQFLLPIEGYPEIKNNSILRVYSKERIKDVYVTRAYSRGKDLVIEGSGFLLLNRDTQDDNYNCENEKEQPSLSTLEDKKIIITNYMPCNLNDKSAHVDLGVYNPDFYLENNENYKKMYSSLGGVSKLKSVEIYNRYLVSSSTQDSNTISSRQADKQVSVQLELISTVFISNASSCTAYKENFIHPWTGEKLVREIVGMVDGKCNYTEQTPNNGIMKCKYGENQKVLMTKYYKGVQMATSTEMHFTIAFSSSTTVGVKNSEAVPLQELLTSGVCIVSGY